MGEDKLAVQLQGAGDESSIDAGQAVLITLLACAFGGALFAAAMWWRRKNSDADSGAVPFGLLSLSFM